MNETDADEANGKRELAARPTHELAARSFLITRGMRDVARLAVAEEELIQIRDQLWDHDFDVSVGAAKRIIDLGAVFDLQNATVQEMVCELAWRLHVFFETDRWKTIEKEIQDQYDVFPTPYTGTRYFPPTEAARSFYEAALKIVFGPFNTSLDAALWVFQNGDPRTNHLAGIKLTWWGHLSEGVLREIAEKGSDECLTMRAKQILWRFEWGEDLDSKTYLDKLVESLRQASGSYAQSLAGDELLDATLWGRWDTWDDIGEVMHTLAADGRKELLDVFFKIEYQLDPRPKKFSSLVIDKLLECLVEWEERGEHRVRGWIAMLREVKKRREASSWGTPEELREEEDVTKKFLSVGFSEMNDQELAVLWRMGYIGHGSAGKSKTTSPKQSLAPLPDSPDDKPPVSSGTTRAERDSMWAVLLRKGFIQPGLTEPSLTTSPLESPEPPQEILDDKPLA